MGLISTTKFRMFSLEYFLLVTTLATKLHGSCLHLQVGGGKGWVKPSENHTDTYNEWANQHDFKVGDIITFKYHDKDSVLEVDQENYAKCNISSAIKMDDRKSSTRSNRASTTIEFQKEGCFYFISGIPDNCQAGEKMVLYVKPNVTYFDYFNPPIVYRPSELCNHPYIVPDANLSKGFGCFPESLCFSATHRVITTTIVVALFNILAMVLVV